MRPVYLTSVQLIQFKTVRFPLIIDPSQQILNMPIDEYANITPIETRPADESRTTPLSTHTTTMPLETHTTTLHHTPYQNRSAVKVEDDRSLGDKIMDFLVGESDVTDEDIAQAELERRQLEEKARMDHFQAQQTADLKKRTMAEAGRMQDTRLRSQIQADLDQERVQEQAQEVVRLENKQAQQQAKKCHETVQQSTGLPAGVNCVKIQKVTEIH